MIEQYVMNKMKASNIQTLVDNNGGELKLDPKHAYFHDVRNQSVREILVKKGYKILMVLNDITIRHEETIARNLIKSKIKKV